MNWRVEEEARIIGKSEFHPSCHLAGGSGVEIAVRG